jgi:hypothetical protein
MCRSHQSEELKMNELTPTTDRFANQAGYSDVTPFEIIRVVSSKTIEIREMTAESDQSAVLDFHLGGFSAHCSNQNQQKWSITSNAAAPVIRARLRGDGFFHSGRGRHFISDSACRFYDYNF